MRGVCNDVLLCGLCFQTQPFRFSLSGILSDFHYKSIYFKYSFKLPRLDEAIQINTYNIWFYKEVDKLHMVSFEDYENFVAVRLYGYMR